MPVIDIDRQTAHEAAVRELAGPAYPHPSPTERFSRWFPDLDRWRSNIDIDLNDSRVARILLVVMALAAVFIAVWVLRRAMRTGGNALLDGSTSRSAADHREQSQQAAGREDWNNAIRHRVRAIARQLEEDGVLSPLPGRTAEEMARTAGLALPDMTTDLATAASLFNDVTYGHRPGSQSGYQVVVDLDERIQRAAPAVGAARSS